MNNKQLPLCSVSRDLASCATIYTLHLLFACFCLLRSLPTDCSSLFSRRRVENIFLRVDDEGECAERRGAR